MLKDQRDLLVAFNAHGVKYLVVGAHAVGVHAEPRGTKDLGILIQADPDNSEAVFAALAEFGAPLAGMSPSDFNDAPGSVFQIGAPPAASTFCKRSKQSPSTKRGPIASRPPLTRASRPT
jgi:hypothetical protein